MISLLNDSYLKSFYCWKLLSPNSFFSRTSHKWNFLPASYFALNYDLQKFKCNVSSHLQLPLMSSLSCSLSSTFSQFLLYSIILCVLVIWGGGWNDKKKMHVCFLAQMLNNFFFPVIDFQCCRFGWNISYLYWFFIYLFFFLKHNKNFWFIMKFKDILWMSQLCVVELLNLI